MTPPTPDLPDPQAAKERLRQQLRETARLLSPEQRFEKSWELCTRLKGHTCWRNAEAMLLFAPLPDEVDVWPLLAAAFGAGKIVALPRYDRENNLYTACQVTDPTEPLPVGRFGIHEPRADCPLLPLAQFDLVAVPGLGFGLDGYRIGRGKGFYDRILSEVTGIKCGVGFESQVFDSVPVEPHDIHLDALVTEERWVAFSPAAGDGNSL